MKTSVNLAGVELKNPVMTASGTFGSGAEYSEFVDLKELGAVVTKGVANVPWPGNPTPRIAEVYGGMLNAIGLQNPGVDVFCERDRIQHSAVNLRNTRRRIPRPRHIRNTLRHNRAKLLQIHKLTVLRAGAKRTRCRHNRILQFHTRQIHTCLHRFFSSSRHLQLNFRT
jgi:dihydroorotate dehydrogenase